MRSEGKPTRDIQQLLSCLGRVDGLSEKRAQGPRLPLQVHPHAGLLERHPLPDDVHDLPHAGDGESEDDLVGPAVGAGDEVEGTGEAADDGRVGSVDGEGGGLWSGWI